jgi:hypothetical protein
VVDAVGLVAYGEHHRDRVGVQAAGDESERSRIRPLSL